MTTLDVATETLATEEVDAGFQRLLAVLAESRELALEPDPHLHSVDEEATVAELELRLSCF